MSEDTDGEMEKDTLLFTASLNKGGKKKKNLLALSAQINIETWHLNKVQR